MRLHLVPGGVHVCSPRRLGRISYRVVLMIVIANIDVFFLSGVIQRDDTCEVLPIRARDLWTRSFVLAPM